MADEAERTFGTFVFSYFLLELTGYISHDVKLSADHIKFKSYSYRKPILPSIFD